MFIIKSCYLSNLLAMIVISSANDQLGLNKDSFDTWDRESLPFPCVPENRPETEGIFYIKVPKTASSTLARITTRFAAREARRQGFVEGEFCKTFDPMKHASASTLQVADRNKSKSFLWSVIRHPNNRAISHYGMRLAFGNSKTSDKNFIDDLKTNGSFRSNMQLDFLTPRKLSDEPKTNEETIQITQNILNEYNFIGIYERLEESLVVLSMIMGMDVNDVLNNFRPSTNTRCSSLVDDPSWLTTGMREYLETDEWKQKQSGDLMLYNAVNDALDATILKLGPEEVKKNLANFKRLVRIGTDLSKRIRKQSGCGVIFPKPYSDIDEVKHFKTLRTRDRNFVRAMKNNNGS